MALVTCPGAFGLRNARTKSAARVLLPYGERHFPCKFSRKLALVTCPCAFRQRGLAQNGT